MEIGLINNILDILSKLKKSIYWKSWLAERISEDENGFFMRVIGQNGICPIIGIFKKENDETRLYTVLSFHFTMMIDMEKTIEFVRIDDGHFPKHPITKFDWVCLGFSPTNDQTMKGGKLLSDIRWTWFTLGVDKIDNNPIPIGITSWIKDCSWTKPLLIKLDELSNIEQKLSTMYSTLAADILKDIRDEILGKFDPIERLKDYDHPHSTGLAERMKERK